MRPEERAARDDQWVPCSKRSGHPLDPLRPFPIGQGLAAAHPLDAGRRVQLVGVEKRSVQAIGERLTDRALARARHTHDDDDHAWSLAGLGPESRAPLASGSSTERRPHGP